MSTSTVCWPTSCHGRLSPRPSPSAAAAHDRQPSRRRRGRTERRADDPESVQRHERARDRRRGRGGPGRDAGGHRGPSRPGARRELPRGPGDADRGRRDGARGGEAPAAAAPAGPTLGRGAGRRRAHRPHADRCPRGHPRPLPGPRRQAVPVRGRGPRPRRPDRAWAALARDHRRGPPAGGCRAPQGRLAREARFADRRARTAPPADRLLLLPAGRRMGRGSLKTAPGSAPHRRGGSGAPRAPSAARAWS